MNLAGAKRLRSLFGWLSTCFSQRGLVLLYHRIAEPGDDPSADVFNLCVSPALFAEHLEVIRSRATPLSLRQLCRSAQRGQLPARAVAVTFDDGYADLAHVAIPLLQRFEVPVTLFAVTGRFGRSFWWDELADAVFAPRSLPGELIVEHDGCRHRHVVRRQNAAARRRLLRFVHGLIRSARAQRPEAIVEQVVGWSESKPEARGLRRSLTTEELSELANSGLCEIGAHTVHHPCLARLDGVAQRREIADSKTALEELIERRVTQFSYPFGTARDFTGATVGLVEQLEFDTACTNIPGAVTRRVDLLRLPRVWAPCKHGAEFDSLLDHWLGR